MLHVSRLTHSEELSALRDDWNRLAGDVPFCRFPWHAVWWKHYQASGRELYVLLARDEQQNLVGIAPWFLDCRGPQGRTVKCLGSGEVCSDYQTLLSDDAHAEAVTEAFAFWLTAAADTRDDGWDLLELDCVPASDRVMTHFIEQLWSAGNTIHREAGPNCWRIGLPATWEDYLATLSKSHRKQVRRFERRQLETGRASFHTVCSDAELSRGMEILVDLHQRRRQSLGEPGCFASERFSGFLHEVAEQFLREGRLRLGWVEIEGAPAAAEFQLAGGRTTYAYQAGVNPDLLDDEPGRIINIATIRRALEEGHRSFDFLRGDEPYKAHWRAEPSETMNCRIVPQRALAQVRHGLWLAGGNVKNWIKSGLELTGMR